jgi:pyruvate,orthophosphate dikinase
MTGRPVTVRLLSPLRRGEAAPTGGVALLITRPDVLEAQVRAVTTAAARAGAHGADARPRILVPLVALPAEVEWVVARLADLAPGVPVGAMVETPRAALAADRMAACSSFLAFGTNDLTELTYGWSRDAAEAGLVDAYRSAGILDVSPFQTIDVGGVVRLLALAAQTARSARPDVGLSLCGEHAGDPRSVAVAAQLGLDAVSTSAWRVPVARLAAAHAVLEGVA